MKIILTETQLKTVIKELFPEKKEWTKKELVNEISRGGLGSMMQNREERKKLLDIAQKYNSREDFKNRDIKSYNKALKLGVIKQLYFRNNLRPINKKVETDKRISPNIFKQTAFTVASKYKNEDEFKNSHPEMYNAIKNDNLFKKIFQKTITQKNKDVSSIKGTEDAVRKEASKYKYKSDFEKGNISAYRYAIKLGIINNLFPERKIKWTEDAVRKEASKYKYKSDFARDNLSAYQNALKLGIINSLFPDYKFKWTEDAVRKEASKYKYKIEFYKNNQSAYDVALKMKIIDELFPEKKPFWNEERPIKWTEDAIRKEASKYKYKDDFRNANYTAYDYALKMKIIDELFPERKHGPHKYTPDEIERTLKQIHSYKDLYKNPSFYEFLRRNKLLDKYFPDRIPRNIKWTEDTIRKEASKYKSKIDFKRGNESAYITSIRLGMINSLFPNSRQHN